jgi:hypothetical protein
MSTYGPRPNTADAVSLQTQRQRQQAEMERGAEKLKALSARASRTTAANRFSALSVSAATSSLRRAQARSSFQSR